MRQPRAAASYVAALSEVQSRKKILYVVGSLSFPVLLGQTLPDSLGSVATLQEGTNSQPPTNSFSPLWMARFVFPKWQ